MTVKEMMINRIFNLLLITSKRTPQILIQMHW